MFGSLKSGKTLTMSFFWSIYKYLVKFELLTVKLEQQLASRPSPDAHGSLRATSQNIVGVRVNCGDRATGSIGKFPDLTLTLGKGTEESVTPAAQNQAIVLGKGHRHSHSSFVRMCCVKALIVAEVPPLKGAI